MKGTPTLGAWLAGLLLISALIVFAGSATAPMKGDEAFYALLADGLRRGGNWLYLQHWWIVSWRL